MLGRFGKSLAETYAGRNIMPGPLELFQGEQRKKLWSFLGEQSFGENLSSYLAGKNVASKTGKMGWGAEDSSRGLFRKALVGGGGGVLAASALGINPFGVTSGLANLGALGGHFTIGSAMYGMGGAGSVAGIGYLGLTALNAFTRGDNLGPL